MSYLKPVNKMTPAEIQKIRAAAINSAIAELKKYRHASVEEMVTDALDLKPDP